MPFFVLHNKNNHFLAAVEARDRQHAAELLWDAPEGSALDEPDSVNDLTRALRVLKITPTWPITKAPWYALGEHQILLMKEQRLNNRQPREQYFFIVTHDDGNRGASIAERKLVWLNDTEAQVLKDRVQTAFNRHGVGNDNWFSFELSKVQKDDIWYQTSAGRWLDEFERDNCSPPKPDPIVTARYRVVSDVGIEVPRSQIPEGDEAREEFLDGLARRAILEDEENHDFKSTVSVAEVEITGED